MSIMWQVHITTSSSFVDSLWPVSFRSTMDHIVPFCSGMKATMVKYTKKKTVIEKSSFIMRKCGVAPPSNARTINIYSLTNWNTARPNPQISFANRCKAVIGMLAKHHTKQGCQNEHEETWRKERKLYYQGYKRDFLRFSYFHLQLSVRFIFF